MYSKISAGLTYIQHYLQHKCFQNLFYGAGRICIKSGVVNPLGLCGRCGLVAQN